MSDRIEIQGKTVEAAVSEALLRMGARRDEVEIKVLEEPKSGFLGILGGRAAKVLVRKKRSRGRGGSGRDFRQDDNDYQAHNLSGGRGRGSRRKPSGGSGGSRPQKDEAQDAGRDDKSRSRRGSRGRGGRGRSQEAAGRDQAQGQRDSRREQPVKAEKQEQTGGRSSGGRSRNERGRRAAPNRQDNRQEGRQDKRQDSRRQDGRQDKRQDTRPEARTGGRPDKSPDGRSKSRPDNSSENRRDNRPARQENVRAEGRTEETPSRPVEGRRNQRREAPAPVPTPVENITPVVEKKEEISVATPKKQKRSFGGLGSRLKEKKAAEKAAAKAAELAAAGPAETPAVAAPSPEPVVTRESAPASAPAPSRDYSHDSRSTGRRGPSRQSEDYADEVILSEISGIKYAKPVGEVTEEGLDDALTELTDGLLARAGFPCRCETHPGEYRQIKVTTDDASAGMLIGRHGQTVDAVEHLVERMASNAIDARARINLDINNYRQRREESLAERVNEAAESIRENGRPVHMEPMSARERRLVHMYAADIEGCRTFTMDRSGGKHVVIAGDNEASGESAPADEQPDY